MPTNLSNIKKKYMHYQYYHGIGKRNDYMDNMMVVKKKKSTKTEIKHKATLKQPIDCSAMQGVEGGIFRVNYAIGAKFKHKVIEL